MLRAPVSLTQPHSLQVLEMPSPRIHDLSCSLGRGLEVWGPEGEAMGGRLWAPESETVTFPARCLGEGLPALGHLSTSQAGEIQQCCRPLVRRLLAFSLGKEGQEGAHPGWHPLDLSPACLGALFWSFCPCPYCSLSFLHSLPLSLQVSHLWGASEGGIG